MQRSGVELIYPWLVAGSIVCMVSRPTVCVDHRDPCEMVLRDGYYRVLIASSSTVDNVLVRALSLISSRADRAASPPRGRRASIRLSHGVCVGNSPHSMHGEARSQVAHRPNSVSYDSSESIKWIGVLMPATKTKPATRTTESAKAKTEEDARVIGHVSQALEAAQEDLASIGGSLGAGARDIRRDIQRLLRDARRDLKKLSKALQRDLEHLQKDLTKTAAKNGHSAVKSGSASAAASTKANSRSKAQAPR
jgi:hypothetical protein